MTTALKPNPNHRGDPHFLPRVLKAFGVTVRELPGWAMWGMGDFDRIQGICVHHTGSNNTSAQYIARNPRLGNGLSSQIHLSRTAPYTATLCGVGIAWHMGRGSHPGWATNNGNPVAIGIEPQSDGVTPWPPEMLDTYYRICAAILWYLGKRATPQTLIGHWEYSRHVQGKWDPGAGNGRSGAVMNMDVFRARVNHYIDNPPVQNQEELSMADIQELKKHITKEAEATRKYVTDFLVGFVGPIGSDVKDTREQVTGGRDARQYPGWEQGGDRTLYDLAAAVAEAAGVPGTRDTLAHNYEKEA